VPGKVNSGFSYFAVSEHDSHETDDKITQELKCRWCCLCWRMYHIGAGDTIEPNKYIYN